MASSTISKLFVEIGFKDKQLRTGLRNAERSVGRLNTSLNRMNSVLGNAVSRSFWALTGAVTGFMAASATVGAKFDREMTFVGAIAGSTGTELESLTNKARELGATTMYTATQSATAMQNFARAGMETNEILSSTGPALMLAGAAGESMDLSTQTLAATMAQFNAQGYEAGQVADVFATALTGSLFDLRSLTEAMKYGGTVGANFGMSLEETTAALAQFRNLGLEGSLAGTNFRMAMAHAAKATDKARKVLDKYNLTAQDINPELHSFGQIMETVGEASMSTTDLLEVFGRRAGANIAGIATQFADGSTDFYNLLGDIEGSAGNVESLYARATDNVLDKFKIVQSAFQELLLTTFDQYREPAMGLMDDIVKMLNDTTGEVNSAGSEIRAAMDDLFSYIQGQMMFMEGGAGSLITNMITGFTEVLITLQLLIPYLDDIFRLLLTMWAVGKVVAFTQAIISLINSVGALRTAFVALKTTMYAMMGPKGWLIAGVTAVVGGIASMVSGWNSNKRAIEANQAAAQKLNDIEEQGRQDRAQGFDDAVSETNQWAGNQLLRLETEGKIDRVYERELERLQQMSAAQLEQGVEAGQIIETMENGEKVYKSVNLLVHDMAQGFINSERSQSQINGAISEREAQISRQNSLARVHQRILRDTQHMFGADSQEGLDNLSHVHERQLEIVADSRGLSRNWRDWVVNIEHAQGESTRVQTILDNILLVQDRSVVSAQRFELALEGVGDQAAENAEDERERQRRADEWQRDYLKATEATGKLDEEINNRLLDSIQSRSEIAARQHQEDVAELNEAYDTELALVRRNSRKVQELEERREDALLTLRTAAQQERYAIMAEVAGETYSNILQNAERTERESLEFRQRQERQIILEQVQDLLAMTGQTEADRLEIWRNANIQLERAQTAHTVEMNHFDRGQAEETAAFIEGLRIETLGPLHSEILANEVALQDALVQNVDASEADKQRIREQFERRRLGIVRDTENDILVFLGKLNADVIALEQEKAATLANLTKETEQYRAAIILQYDALIAQARAKGPDDPLEEELSALDKFIKAMAESAGESFTDVYNQLSFFAKTAYEDFAVISEPVDWLAGAGKKISDGLSPAAQRLKGIGAAIGGAMGQARDAIVDTEIQATKPLGQAVEAAATGFYQMGQLGVKASKGLGAGLGWLGGKLLKVGKAAVAVGKFVSGVADKMGAMFSKALDGLNALTGFDFSLIDTVGEVNDIETERKELEAQLASGDLDEDERADVQAQLDALPSSAAEASRNIVTDMIESSIQMVQTFAESAPYILQTLAENIPILLNAVAQNLPIIIQGITTAIPAVVFAIIDSIPLVVQALVDNLPALFQTIFAMIPTVITALMDAMVALLPMVGEIIASFIMAIPDIVFALLEAIPGLIIALVEQIEVIVEALVAMIPQLIFAVATALPGIVSTLVEMALGLLIFLVEQIPILVQGVVEQIPFLINSILGKIPHLIKMVITMLPVLIDAIIEAVPLVIKSVIDALPEVIATIIAALPDIIMALLEALPTIAYELVRLIVMLALVELPIMAWEFLKTIGQFFYDLIAEIFSLGKAKTETFGDTPGMQYAGNGARMATFAAGDYFAAARTPLGVLRQAVDSVKKQGIGAAALGKLSGLGGITPASAQIPGLMGLSGAMLSMVDAVGSGAGSQQPLKVVVTAEGETLDSVMFTAQKRGHMPNLKRDFSKASGVKVGFDRGKFQYNS